MLRLDAGTRKELSMAGTLRIALRKRTFMHASDTSPCPGTLVDSWTYRAVNDAANDSQRLELLLGVALLLQGVVPGYESMLNALPSLSE